MSSLLQEGRRNRRDQERRGRRRRARRRLWALVATVALGLLALLVVMVDTASSPEHSASSAGRGEVASHHPVRPVNTYGSRLAATQIDPRFRTRVTSGLLLDLRTGEVLWARAPRRVLPIASLTKMMTALIVDSHSHLGEQVLITRQAVNFSGSGVGQLPLGKKVSLHTLLFGLLLPSGNDAAIALAQRVAGSEAGFVAMMNARARAMGLGCTHFSTVSGILDRGNYSCAVDLARMAHALLLRPELAHVVATSSAEFPFPIPAGKLYLYNNNPLLQLRYPGTDGVKTGYTTAAGKCLVASAHRGSRHLVVVLLHSDDPPDQARRLLDLGFGPPPRPGGRA